MVVCQPIGAYYYNGFFKTKESGVSLGYPAFFGHSVFLANSMNFLQIGDWVLFLGRVR